MLVCVYTSVCVCSFLVLSAKRAWFSLVLTSVSPGHVATYGDIPGCHDWEAGTNT